MAVAPPPKSSKPKGIIWVFAIVAVILIALLIAYPFWSAMERRQARMETEWTGTLFLDIYLRNQAVPPLLLTQGLAPSTAEARLVAIEKKDGNPLRRYHIVGWHSHGEGGNRTADVYYEVDFKKTAEPLHLRLVHQDQDWKVADVVWESSV